MLIALPTAGDKRQVARWHDQQAALKSRRTKSLTKKLEVFAAAELARDVKRHQRVANQLRQEANKMEKA
jgi:hypothetical protein